LKAFRSVSKVITGIDAICIKNLPLGSNGNDIIVNCNQCNPFPLLSYVLEPLVQLAPITEGEEEEGEYEEDGEGGEEEEGAEGNAAEGAAAEGDSPTAKKKPKAKAKGKGKAKAKAKGKSGDAAAKAKAKAPESPAAEMPPAA